MEMCLQHEIFSREKFSIGFIICCFIFFSEVPTISLRSINQNLNSVLGLTSWFRINSTTIRHHSTKFRSNIIITYRSRKPPTHLPQSTLTHMLQPAVHIINPIKSWSPMNTVLDPPSCRCRHTSTTRPPSTFQSYQRRRCHQSTKHPSSSTTRQDSSITIRKPSQWPSSNLIPASATSMPQLSLITIKQITFLRHLRTVIIKPDQARLTTSINQPDCSIHTFQVSWHTPDSSSSNISPQPNTKIIIQLSISTRRRTCRSNYSRPLNSQATLHIHRLRPITRSNTQFRCHPTNTASDPLQKPPQPPAFPWKPRKRIDLTQLSPPRVIFRNVSFYLFSFFHKFN